MDTDIEVIEAELLLDAKAELAEGPVWDDRTNTIVWVDILKGEIHRTTLQGEDELVARLPEPVGCIALSDNDDIVAATPTGFRLVDEKGKYPYLARLPLVDESLRMNDGAVDPLGRFLAGTMAYDETPDSGTLWSWDGKDLLLPVLSGVTISNGIGWSLDGSAMYFIDTPKRTIDTFHYDVSDGVLAQRKTFADLSAEVGVPDGLAIDADGGVWVALWDGGAVLRTTDTGVDMRVLVDRRRPTSCVVAGVVSPILVVTAATDPVASGAPNGGLFGVEVGVAGLATPRVAA